MKSKILIIQNTKAVDSDLQDRLRAPDFEIIGSAGSLGEARLVAAARPPDVIILDTAPESGFEAVETAKRVAATHHCAFVCLLSDVDEETLQGLCQAASFAYLVKPCDEKGLRFAIELARHKWRINQELIAAKNALFEKEKQSRELLDNLPIGIYRTTPQGKIGRASCRERV